jgi:hypothetical protein
MRFEQPGDVQAAGAFASPAADFDHLRPAFGCVAQRDQVARHAMQHNRKGRPEGRPKVGRPQPPYLPQPSLPKLRQMASRSSEVTQLSHRIGG